MLSTGPAAGHMPVQIVNPVAWFNINYRHQHVSCNGPQPLLAKVAALRRIIVARPEICSVSKGQIRTSFE